MSSSAGGEAEPRLSGSRANWDDDDNDDDDDEQIERVFMRGEEEQATAGARPTWLALRRDGLLSLRAI